MDTEVRLRAELDTLGEKLRLLTDEEVRTMLRELERSEVGN